MSQEQPVSVVQLLSRALHNIRSTPPRIIASPPTQPRRAAVALIIRVVPPPSSSLASPPAAQPTLTEFFEFDWVNDPGARPEILFLHRENSSASDAATAGVTRAQNTNEAHVTFPGGRTEEGDEGGLYTALRQTWEETGLDLAEQDYTCIGQLDDREITTSLGKRLLVILSPFIFLQLNSRSVATDPVPGTTLHWIPLASFISPHSSPRWSTVTVDAASRLAPKNSTILRVLVRLLVGSMQFPAIVLETSTSTREGEKSSSVAYISTSVTPRPRPERLKLWGLSLGMTLDLLAYMEPSTNNHNSQSHFPAKALSPALQLPLPYQVDGQMRVDLVAPSLASVFPRFSYPDVNFWIWVFGKRYREVIRGWEASVRSGGTNDRRINWSGSALSTFYAAIRKALVVVIVVRALGLLFGLTFTGWWIFKS